MARREAFATIIDTADKMPDKVGQDGYLYKWDNDLKKYVNSGQRMTALDDPSAVKVFKLAESGTATPTAPKGVGGAADGFKSLVELKDNVLGTGVTDWHDDPQSVSKDYPIQWCAVYGYKNVPISAVGQTEVLFEERYTLTSVILYSTFGAYFTTDGTSITIHNPDGSTVVQPIATPAMVQELQRGLEGVKKQIDGLKESYSGSGAPTLDRSKYPLNKWFEEFGSDLPTDPAIITNIYKAHLDDTYLDSDSLVAYRFIQKPGTPDGAIASYVWEVVGDNALSKAIADLHKVAGESVKIFATQPTPPYKVGDIWIYDAAKGLSRTCIKAKAQGEAYSATDWLDPYATAEEVNVIRQDLAQAKQDLATAKGNITDLGKAMTDFSGTFGEALKGNIDLNAYKQTLPDLQKQLDREQAELSASINRVLASTYLTDDALKNNLQLSKTEVLDAGGKLDQLQKMVDTALADATLTADEVASIQNLQASYNTAYKILKERFEACEAFVDKQIPASLHVGGVNLIRSKDYSGKNDYEIKTDTGELFFTGQKIYKLERVAVGIPPVLLHKLSLTKGQTVTLSCYVKCIAPQELYSKITIYSQINRKEYAYKSVTKLDEWERLVITFTPEQDIDDAFCYFYGGRDVGSITYFTSPQLVYGNVETAWSENPEDVEARYQAQIDAINANPPRVNPTTKNWEVYRFVDGVGGYVDTGDTSVGDDGKAPEIRDGYWWVYDGTKYVNSGTRAIGKDAQGVRPNLLPLNNLKIGTEQLTVIGNVYTNGRITIAKENIGRPSAFMAYNMAGQDKTYVGGQLVGKTLIYSYYVTNNTNVPLVIGSHVYLDISRTIPVQPGETSRRYMVRTDGYQYFLIYTASLPDNTTEITGSVDFFDFKVEECLDGEEQTPTAYMLCVADTIGTEGAPGKDALIHTIQVQGELALKGVAVKDGKLLITPEFIKEVRGGVNGYVQCKLIIDKGGRDVTTSALEKGADPLWYIVAGSSRTLIQTGGQILNFGKEYADGVNDYILCTIEDARMAEW